MGTKIILPSYLLAMHNYDVKALTGFDFINMEGMGGDAVRVELVKTLSAAEKNAMSTTIQSKVINYKEV